MPGLPSGPWFPHRSSARKCRAAANSDLSFIRDIETGAAVTRAATISSFGMSMSSVGRRRSDTPTCLVSPHLLQIRLSVRGLSEVKTLLPTSVRTGGVEMKRHIPRYRFVFSMVQPFRRLTCLRVVLGYAVIHLDPGDMKFEPSASDLPH
jgi:hypothetical protein